MRKCFPLLLALGLGLAHGQDLIWSKEIGNGDLQTLKTMRSDVQGNLLLFGTFTTYPMDSGPARKSFGGADVFLHKLDPAGRTSWFRNMGTGANSDKAIDMDVDSAGNIYVLADLSASLGARGKLLSSGSDTLLADPEGIRGFTLGKYSPDGKVLWVRQFQNSSAAWLRQIRACNGKLILAGDFTGQVKFLGSPDSLIAKGDGYRGFLAELDGEGGVHSLAEIDSVETVLMARADGFGGLFLGLAKTLNSGFTFLERRRSDGETAWRRPMVVETGSMGFQDLAADGAGNVYVGGKIAYGTRVNLGRGRDTLVNVSNPPDFYVMKLDTAGNLLWYRFGMAGYSPFSNFTLAPDRSVTFMSFSSGQAWRLDPDGKPLWNFKASPGGIHNEYPPSTALDPTGAIVFGATFTNKATFLGHSFTCSGIENILLFKVTGHPTRTRKQSNAGGSLSRPDARPWWIRFLPDGRTRPSTR